MATKAHLVIDQGTDFSATIDLTDAVENVFDLTGYAVRSQMRKNYASATAYDFTVSHNDDQGQIFMEMDNATTNTIEPGRYLYDVEVVSAANTVTRVVEGIVTVTPGRTR